ncbi:MAG: acyl carrier protein [Blautia sp.]|nr:acyl carrier protein [Blautia sp.]
MDYEKIKGLIEAHFPDAQGLTQKSSLTDDLGLNSVDLFSIIMEIESIYDIELPTDAIGRLETIEDLVTEVREALQ